MKSSYSLIQETKKKFFAFSLVGIVLVTIISYFGLSTYNEVVDQQKSVNIFYRKLSKQLGLINKIAFLSARFDEIEKSKEIHFFQTEFNDLVNKLALENISLNSWLESNRKVRVRYLGELIKEKELNKKLNGFVKMAKNLVHSDAEKVMAIKNDLKFLARDSLEGLRRTFDVIKEKIRKEQDLLFEKLMKMGFFLVGICILQIILVWLLVFRPLYTTITAQHNSLSEALLKAKSASRSKTDFLANISHEIRTPMTAILGYADLLRNDKLKKEERVTSVEVINKNASHLLGLIDEILDISKIEAGKFDFELKEVHLSTLLNEVYSLINVKAREKGIDLRFSNSGKLPREVKVDPKRIKQILFNLIGNAIKFTDKGFVKLIANFDGNSDRLIFEIRDSGCGIPKKEVSKLFKPFQQADTSSTRAHQGSGLGLVLSKGLARGMGGNIRIIETKVNVGTIIEASVAANTDENTVFVSKLSTSLDYIDSTPEMASVLDGVKILVVDDAKENARLFKIYLDEVGADTEIANDGQTALDLALSNDFDIILLDLQMPGIDGFEVIERLRKKNYQKPILALTAHAMKEEKQKTKEAGFNAHITKPVKADHLVDTIAKFV